MTFSSTETAVLVEAGTGQGIYDCPVLPTACSLNDSIQVSSLLFPRSYWLTF